MSLLEESDHTVVTSATPTTTAAHGRSLRGDLRALLRLAVPVVLAEIGWMSMGIVDTLMVGPLGPQAIGAAGVGSHLFAAVGFFGMGLLLGLDTLVSQAFGGRRLDEAHRWLFHGVALALLLSVPLSLIVWIGTRLLGGMGLHPEVAPLAASYMVRINYGLLPLLLYAACRRYLQAVGFVGPLTFALVSANVINACFNWVLIYGKLGFPALGTDGAAWATTVSRTYMAAVVIGGVIWHDRRVRGTLWQTSRRVEAAMLRRLLALGGPAATQLLAEVGVFAAATALAGTLAPVQLAAHQIALQIISLIFMVPLGIAASGAVLVGHAIGRQDGQGAGRAGWVALALAATFMSLLAIVFVAMPAPLIALFIADRVVIGVGTSLLMVASIFQLFDGIQVVATGVLRGAGDTRTAMISNLAGHWIIGLPVGWWCCFVLGWGVVGLWVGLSVGLTLVGIVLIGVWARTSRALRRGLPVPAHAAR